MKTLILTKAWILLCSVLAVASSAPKHGSLHHDGLQHHRATTTPSGKKHHNPAMSIGIQLPDQVLSTQEASCISADNNIFEIMNKARDTCKGKDFLCTFYLYANHKYHNIGAFEIDKVLFDTLLTKYDNWLLTAEKIDLKDTVPYSKDHHKKIRKKVHENITAVDAKYMKNKEVDNDSDQTNSPITLDEVPSLTSNRNFYIDKIDHDIYNDNTINPTNLPSSSDYNIGDTRDETTQHIKAPTKSYSRREKNEEINRKYDNYVRLDPIYNKKHKRFEVYLPKHEVQGQPRTIHVNINDENYKHLLFENEKENKPKSIENNLENEISPIPEHAAILESHDQKYVDNSYVEYSLASENDEKNYNENVCQTTSGINKYIPVSENIGTPNLIMAIKDDEKANVTNHDFTDILLTDSNKKAFQTEVNDNTVSTNDKPMTDTQTIIKTDLVKNPELIHHHELFPENSYSDVEHTNYINLGKNDVNTNTILIPIKNNVPKPEIDMVDVRSKIPTKDVVDFNENQDTTLLEELTINELKNNNEYKIHTIEPTTVDKFAQTNNGPVYFNSRDNQLNNLVPHVYNNINGNQKLISEDSAENGFKDIVHFSDNVIVPNKYRNNVKYYVGSDSTNNIDDQIPMADIPNITFTDNENYPQNDNNNNIVMAKQSKETDKNSNFKMPQLTIIETEKNVNEHAYLDTESLNSSKRDNQSVFNNIEHTFIKNGDTLNLSGDNQKVAELQYDSLKDMNEISIERANFTSNAIHLEENPNIYNEGDFDNSHDLTVHKNNSLRTSHIHLNEPVDRIHHTIGDNDVTSTTYNPVRPKMAKHTPISDYTGSQLDLFQKEPINSDPVPLIPLYKSNISTESSKTTEPDSKFQFLTTNLLPYTTIKLADVDVSQNSQLDIDLPQPLSVPNNPKATSSILPVPPFEYERLIKADSKIPSSSRIEELRLPNSDSKQVASKVEDLSLDRSSVSLLPGHTIPLKDSGLFHGEPSFDIDTNEYTLVKNQAVQEVTPPLFTTSAAKNTFLLTSPSNSYRKFTNMELNNNMLATYPAVSNAEFSPPLALDNVEPHSNEVIEQSIDPKPITLQPVLTGTPPPTNSQRSLLEPNVLQSSPVSYMLPSLATKMIKSKLPQIPLSTHTVLLEKDYQHFPATDNLDGLFNGLDIQPVKNLESPNVGSLPLTPESLYPLNADLFITQDKDPSINSRKSPPLSAGHNPQLNIKFPDPSTFEYSSIVLNPFDSPSPITKISLPCNEGVQSLELVEELIGDTSTLLPLESYDINAQMDLGTSFLHKGFTLSRDIVHTDEILPLQTQYTDIDEITQPHKSVVISNPPSVISPLYISQYRNPEERHPDLGGLSSQFVEQNLEKELLLSNTFDRFPMITESSAYPKIPSRIITRPSSMASTPVTEKVPLLSVPITPQLEIGASTLISDISQYNNPLSWTSAFTNSPLELQTKSAPPTIFSDEAYPTSYMLQNIPSSITDTSMKQKPTLTAVTQASLSSEDSAVSNLQGPSLQELLTNLPSTPTVSSPSLSYGELLSESQISQGQGVDQLPSHENIFSDHLQSNNTMSSHNSAKSLTYYPQKISLSPLSKLLLLPEFDTVKVLDKPVVEHRYFKPFLPTPTTHQYSLLPSDIISTTDLPHLLPLSEYTSSPKATKDPQLSQFTSLKPKLSSSDIPQYKTSTYRFPPEGTSVSPSVPYTSLLPSSTVSAIPDSKSLLNTPRLKPSSPLCLDKYPDLGTAFSDEDVLFTISQLQNDIQSSLDTTDHNLDVSYQKLSPILSHQANEFAPVESTIERPEILIYPQHTTESQQHILPLKTTQNNLPSTNILFQPSDCNIIDSGDVKRLINDTIPQNLPLNLQKVSPQMIAPLSTFDQTYNINSTLYSVNPEIHAQTSSTTETVVTLSSDRYQLLQDINLETEPCPNLSKPNILQSIYNTLPSKSISPSNTWSAKYIPHKQQNIPMSASCTSQLLYEDSLQLSKDISREVEASAPIQSVVFADTEVSSLSPLDSSLITSPHFKPINTLASIVPSVSQYTTPIPTDTRNPNERSKTMVLTNPRLSLNPCSFSFKIPSSIPSKPFQIQNNPLLTSHIYNSAFHDTKLAVSEPHIISPEISDISDTFVPYISQDVITLSDKHPVLPTPITGPVVLPSSFYTNLQSVNKLYTSQILPALDYINNVRVIPYSQVTKTLSPQSPKVTEKESSFAPYITHSTDTEPTFQPENIVTPPQQIKNYGSEAAKTIPHSMKAKPFLKLDSDIISYPQSRQVLNIPQACETLVLSAISDLKSDIIQPNLEHLENSNPSLTIISGLTPADIPTAVYTKPVSVTYSELLSPPLAKPTEPIFTSPLSQNTNGLIPTLTNPITPTYSQPFLPVSLIGPSLSSINELPSESSSTHPITESSFSLNYEPQFNVNDLISEAITDTNYINMKSSPVLTSPSISKLLEYSGSDENICTDSNKIVEESRTELSLDIPVGISSYNVTDGATPSSIVPDHSMEQVLERDLYKLPYIQVPYSPIYGAPISARPSPRQSPLPLKSLIHTYLPNLSVSTPTPTVPSISVLTLPNSPRLSFSQIPLAPIKSLTLPFPSLVSPSSSECSCRLQTPKTSQSIPSPNLLYFSKFELPERHSISTINFALAPVNNDHSKVRSQLPPSAVNSNYLPNSVASQISIPKPQPPAPDMPVNFILSLPSYTEFTSNLPLSQSQLRGPAPILNYNKHKAPISSCTTDTMPLLETTFPQSLTKFKSTISPQYVAPLTTCKTLLKNTGLFSTIPWNPKLTSTLFKKYVKSPAKYTNATPEPDNFKVSLKTEDSLAPNNLLLEVPPSSKIFGNSLLGVGDQNCVTVNSPVSSTPNLQFSLPYKPPISKTLVPQSQILPPFKDFIVLEPTVPQITVSPVSPVFVSIPPKETPYFPTISNIHYNIPQNSCMLPCTKPLVVNDIEQNVFPKPKPSIVHPIPKDLLSLLKQQPTLPFSLKPLSVQSSSTSPLVSESSLTGLDSNLQTVTAQSLVSSTTPLLKKQMVYQSPSNSPQQYVPLPSTNSLLNMEFTEPKSNQLTSTDRPSQLPSISITPEHLSSLSQADTIPLDIKMSKNLHLNKPILSYTRQYQPSAPVDVKNILVSPQLSHTPNIPIYSTSLENIPLSQIPNGKYFTTSVTPFNTKPQTKVNRIPSSINKKESSNESFNYVRTLPENSYSQLQKLYPVPYETPLTSEKATRRPGLPLGFPEIIEVTKPLEEMSISVSEHDTSRPSQLNHGILNKFVAELSAQSQLMPDIKYKSSYLPSLALNQPSSFNLQYLPLQKQNYTTKSLLKYYPESLPIQQALTSQLEGMSSDKLKSEVNADFLQTSPTSSQLFPISPQYVSSETPINIKNPLLTHLGSQFLEIPKCSTVTSPISPAYTHPQYESLLKFQSFWSPKSTSMQPTIECISQPVTSTPNSEKSVVSPLSHNTATIKLSPISPQLSKSGYSTTPLFSDWLQSQRLQTTLPVRKETIISPPMEILDQSYHNRFRLPPNESPILPFRNTQKSSFVIYETPFKSCHTVEPISRSLFKPKLKFPEPHRKLKEHNICLNDLFEIDSQTSLSESANIYLNKYKTDVANAESFTESSSIISEINENNVDLNKTDINNVESLDSPYDLTESFNKFDYCLSKMQKQEEKYNSNFNYVDNSYQIADVTSDKLHISKAQLNKYEMYSPSDFTVDSNIVNVMLPISSTEAIYETYPESYAVAKSAISEYNSNTLNSLPASQYTAVDSAKDKFSNNFPYLIKDPSNISKYTPYIATLSNYPKHQTLTSTAEYSQTNKTPNLHASPQGHRATSIRDDFYNNNHIGKSPQIYTIPKIDTKSHDLPINPYKFAESASSTVSLDVRNGFEKSTFRYFEPLTQLHLPLISTNTYNQIPDIPTTQLPTAQLPTAQLPTTQLLTVQLPTAQLPIPKYNSFKPDFKSSPQIKQYYPLQSSQTPLESDFTQFSPVTPSYVPYNNIDKIGYSGYKTYHIPAPKSEEVYQIPNIPEIYNPSSITQTLPTTSQYQKSSTNILSSPFLTSGSNDFHENAQSNNPTDNVAVYENNVDENRELKTSLINYINSKKQLKSKLFNNNNELEIPLGIFVIANHVPAQDHTIPTKNPSIGLRVWKSNVKVIEADIKLKIKDFSVNNFMPVVNNLDEYDKEEIRKIIKEYIDEKYGNHIEVNEPYTIDNQYTVIKDFKENVINNKCNLLWPTNYE